MKKPAALSLITLLVATIAYVFTTFATMEYVNIKHESVKEDLAEIKDMLLIIDERIYKINKGDK